MNQVKAQDTKRDDDAVQDGPAGRCVEIANAEAGAKIATPMGELAVIQ